VRKIIILAGCVLAIAAGCENPEKIEIKTLREEKTQLTRQIEQANTENEQLKKQVAVLSALPADGRLENLYHLQQIKITDYTNFYDKDKDGKKETLIVYIQPIDGERDIVKATGAVDVQLWDLNKAEGEALLRQWHVGPEELKKLWLVTLITVNYRLSLDLGDIVDKIKTAEALTVKVKFTDYLTGKEFEEQKVIKP